MINMGFISEKKENLYPQNPGQHILKAQLHLIWEIQIFPLVGAGWLVPENK